MPTTIAKNNPYYTNSNSLKNRSVQTIIFPLITTAASRNKETSFSLIKLHPASVLACSHQTQAAGGERVHGPEQKIRID